MLPKPKPVWLVRLLPPRRSFLFLVSALAVTGNRFGLLSPISTTGSCTVCRINGTELDVAVNNARIGFGDFYLRRNAGVSRAGTTSNTRLRGISVCRVCAVEPEHVNGMVIPNGKRKNHPSADGAAHCGHATEILERVSISKSSLLLFAKTVANRIGLGNTTDFAHTVLNDLAVLNVEPANLRESTRIRTIACNELCNDGELLGRVDGSTGAVERGITHAVAVEVTAVFIADTRVALVTIAAVGPFATGLTVDTADMRGVGGRDAICFPNIHFVAAGAVLASASIYIVGRAFPAFNISLDGVSTIRTTDEYEMTWCGMH